MKNYVAVSPRYIKGEIVDMTHCDDCVYCDDNRVHPEEIICRKYEQMLKKRGDQDDAVINILRQAL